MTALHGRWACRFCRHDQYEHNLREGCPHCWCAATPGEASARSGREMALVILPPGEYLRGYEPRESQEAVDAAEHCISVEAALEAADRGDATHWPTVAGVLAKEVEHLRGVLQELVDLKDGPRGADYERRKPAAWEAARDALACEDT